ncbi:TPR repeat region-containing protein [Nocardia stercoris]|uniref:TPR repeat domain-containing protein n=1 Tax=Nocardia stercoris TaxID=2483361 RepID=A0A3M2KZ34_9NOCA|nr:hypothetical protein [Nocardia stercoris]RMI29896.1 hypothetical protein EBN03_24190 [Nocardia stercoris]
MPTRKQVEQWDFSKLDQLAQHLVSAGGDLEAQLGRMVTQFSDTTWTGVAHDAACDRFTQENDDDRRLGADIKDLGTAVTAASSGLANEVRVLMGKVADAEHDKDPYPLTVSDKWEVQATFSASHPTEAQIKSAQDQINRHQGLINAAYTSLALAIVVQTKGINDAAAKIVARGELIARGIDDTHLSDADISKYGMNDDPAGTAAQDVKALEDGTATPEQIARLQAQSTLTPDELESIKDGKPANITPAQFQYLQGVMQAENGMSPKEIADLGSKLSPGDATTVQSSMSNAMQIMSNPKITADGGLTGGMPQLPKNVQDILKNSKPLMDANDGTQRNALGDIAQRGDSALRQGTDFDRGLLKQGSILADSNSWLADSDGAIANKLLDAASGDHQADSDFISGHGMDSTLGTGEKWGKDHMMAVLSHQWTPEQHGAQTMFSWIGPDASSTDDNVSKLAGQTSNSLAQFLSDNSDNLAKNLPGHDGQSLGAVNPALTQTLASTMVPYLGNFVGADPHMLINQTTGGLQHPDDLSKMFAVLDSDPAAAKSLNAAGAEWNDYFAYQAGMDPPSAPSIGIHSGQLSAAMGQGLNQQLQDLTAQQQWKYTEQYNHSTEMSDITAAWPAALPGVGTILGPLSATADSIYKADLTPPGDPTHPLPPDKTASALQSQVQTMIQPDAMRMDWNYTNGYATHDQDILSRFNITDSSGNTQNLLQNWNIATQTPDPGMKSNADIFIDEANNAGIPGLSNYNSFFQYGMTIPIGTTHGSQPAPGAPR